jgi:hypothetical protein
MTSGCDLFRELIPRSLLGDIGPAERQALDTHLSECPACRMESEAYGGTLSALQSLEDAAIPRHFFVYPAERRIHPWQLFRSMTPTWQVASAVAATVALVVVGAAASRLQVQFSQGILYAGFGKLPALEVEAQPASEPDTAAMEARIARAVLDRTQADDREWVRNLRVEMLSRRSDLSAAQRAILETALNGLEARFSSRISAAVQSLQDTASLSQSELYRTVSLERQRDLAVLNERLDQLAINDERRTNQTDAILETLLQVADLRLSDSSGGRR